MRKIRVGAGSGRAPSVPLPTLELVQKGFDWEGRIKRIPQFDEE